MAFVDPKQVIRLNVPHEPGEWVDVRVTSIGDLEAAGAEAKFNTAVSVRLAVLKRIVVGWSFDRPVSEDNLRALDTQTYSWLDEASVKATGLRDEPEKKALNGNSLPMTAQDGASSPASSAI